MYRMFARCTINMYVLYIQAILNKWRGHSCLRHARGPSGLVCVTFGHTLLPRSYDKLNEDLRKRSANQKRELYKTGGGPELKDEKKDDDLLMPIVNDKTVLELDTHFDCDIIEPQTSRNRSENIISTLDKSTLETEAGSSTSCDNVVEIIYEEASDNEKDWKKAETLKRPIISSVLQHNVQKICTTMPAKKIKSRRGPNIVVPLTSSRLGEKYELLIEKKLELVECFKKEHALRMQSLELDIALKKKQLSMDNKSNIVTHKDSNEDLLESQVLF